MSENHKKPVAPYMALGLSKVVYGNSHIVDYYGNIMSYSASGYNMKFTGKTSAA
jgi:hypothetical protein